MLKADFYDHQVFANAEVAALFGDRAEGPAFLQALGSGHAIEMAALVAADGDRLMGASSTFWLPFDMALDTPRLKTVVHQLRKLRPKTAFLRLHGLGGIHTGEPQLVMAGDLTESERDATFGVLLDAAEAEGTRRGAHLHAVMELSNDDVWAGELLKQRGYFPMQGVPIAWLHLPYQSMDEYLRSRSHKFRYNLKRKIARAQAEIDVTETSVIDAALNAEIEDLARSQQAHAKVHLGGLELMPEGFHRRLADLAPERVTVLLYRLAGRLVGFGYMIAESDVIYGKNLGLAYPEAQDFNLVHYNLYCSIDAAIRRRKRWLVLGQAGYPTKLRFGARLVRRTTYLKGRGFFGPMLRLVAPRLDKSAWPRNGPSRAISRIISTQSPRNRSRQLSAFGAHDLNKLRIAWPTLRSWRQRKSTPNCTGGMLGGVSFVRLDYG